MVKRRPAAAAYSPSISAIRPPAPPVHVATGFVAEPSREHAAAAAAAVATLQSLKHSARRLVEATRAGSYWRPQDESGAPGSGNGEQEIHVAQTELHAAAAQLKQLRLTAPSSGTVPAAAAPARKALAFTPAATPFAALAPAAAKMPRRPLADISTSADSAAAGAAGWGVRRSSESWVSNVSRVVPHAAPEAASGSAEASVAAAAVSDSFLITPAPRAPPVAPLPIRRSKIPVLTQGPDLASGATPAIGSMPPLHLGTPAVICHDVPGTPMAAAAAAYPSVSTSGSGTSGSSAAGGLSSILAEVAEAAAAKAMQAGLIRPDLVSPPGATSSDSGTGGSERSRLPRLVPWPALIMPQSQVTGPPAPVPTLAASAITPTPGIFASAGRGSSAVAGAVRDLDGGDESGGPCSTRSSIDGSAGATDSNKENCQPPSEESPTGASGTLLASGASPSFRLAGRELPSDAEVQAFLAATALSHSPAAGADTSGAPPPPLPLSPLESLLRVLPSAVEVLVVQLCALADLAAERQREVLAWHFQANACTMPQSFVPHTNAPTCTRDAATPDLEKLENLTPTASSGSAASSNSEPPGCAADLAAMTAAVAGASASELAAAARCNSAEGLALALIGRLVDELLMMPSAEGLALELQAQAQAQHHEQEAHEQAPLVAAEETGEQVEPLGDVMPTVAVQQREEDRIGDSSGGVDPGDSMSAVEIPEETEASESDQRVTPPLSPAAMPQHHPNEQPQPEAPQDPAFGYPGLTSDFLAYLQEEDTFSLWSPSNAAAALFHQWAAETTSAAPFPDQAAGPSPPSLVSGLTLLLPVQGLRSAGKQATPQSSSGSCTAGGPTARAAARDAPPCPHPFRGDHDSGGGAYLRSVARARAAAGENVEWHEAVEQAEYGEDERLDESDAGSHVGPWAVGALQRSGAPSPESPYLRLLRATAAAAVAMSGAANTDGSDVTDPYPAIPSPDGGQDSGQLADTPVGRRLRVFGGMTATPPPVPAAPFADEELGAPAAMGDSGSTTEPPNGQGSVAVTGSDGEAEAAPLDDSVAGSEAEGLQHRDFSAAALAAWSPLPDTPGSARALWRPRLPGNLDA